MVATDEAAARVPVRGTQSFVYVMVWVWKRPWLTAMEVAWRWAFGVVALWLVGSNAARIWMAATQGTGRAAVLGIDHLSVMDPVGVADKMSAALVVLWPPVEATCVWLLPVLFGGWVVLSALGRMVVMQRMDALLERRPGTLMALGAVRVLFLAGTFWVWFRALVAAGEATVSGPAGRGQEPNLVGYFAIVIAGTLVLFVAWAAASWVLSLAPMLAMLRGYGAWQSLREATRLRALRGKLFEINLVMGIVKIALVVLAMVFSATPLPFQTYATQGFLWGWWAAVTVLYLLASDFFHVVRVAAYLELWRTYDAMDGGAVREVQKP